MIDARKDSSSPSFPCGAHLYAISLIFNCCHGLRDFASTPSTHQTGLATMRPMTHGCNRREAAYALGERSASVISTQYQVRSNC
jgi:hypothetical protein